eukprot:scaffold5222_cov293-Pinguiococcus_pyrenoidosus.AAC.5
MCLRSSAALPQRFQAVRGERLRPGAHLGIYLRGNYQSRPRRSVVDKVRAGRYCGFQHPYGGVRRRWRSALGELGRPASANQKPRGDDGDGKKTSRRRLREEDFEKKTSRRRPGEEGCEGDDCQARGANRY